MFDAQVLAYAGLAALLTVTPGADTMLVIRNVLSRGWLHGIFTSLGGSTGLFVHAAVSALGLSVLLVRSAAAYETVKMLGAAYLFYLGIKSFRQALKKTGRHQDGPKAGNSPARRDDRLSRSFSEGLLTSLLNPKVAVFYLAVLPQFIGPGDPLLAKSLLLAGIHVCMGVAWLSAVSICLGRVRGLLSGDKLKRRLEMATGGIMVAFGFKLALDRA